ncbi:MAG: SemiSWEET transporter [Leptospiraceae bacterium]|nr:SemiSWEET transporter [Leptospiraceae bacterium]MCK6381558.1 SemiSWEET transporter [Leptospiraceae bacterium]NUM42145.1 SemiSWEET transporter [Leptospiraceae bacterium]
MSLETLIGYIAGLLTTIAFVPQMLKVILTRKTTDVSRNMYIVLILGISCWIYYGVLHKELPIIISNVFVLIFSLIILIYKLKEK